MHSLTSPVALSLTANMLLAAGCEPSLSDQVETLPDFLSSSHALLINLGMMDARRAQACLKAATITELPWVLDPVMCHKAESRLDLACELASHNPAVIRGNHAEIDAMLKRMPGLETTCVIARTGKIDRVSCPEGRMCELTGGHAWMSRVTAMGCAGTALISAALACEEDPFLACCAALNLLKTVGEKAGETAPGLGSFPVHFFDHLHQMTEACETSTS